MNNIFKKIGIFALFLIVMCLPVLADPIATTNDATSVDETTVTLNGALTNLTEDNSTVYFYYKKSSESAYTQSSTQVLTTNTTFAVNLTGLIRDTKYVYLAAVTNANGSTEYNATAVKSFTTLKTELDRGVEQGVNTTTTILYTALGLIALMILVGAAVFIYTMFGSGMDAQGLIYLTVASIGGAIVLVVGIVIIGLVAQSIIG